MLYEYYMANNRAMKYSAKRVCSITSTGLLQHMAVHTVPVFSQVPELVHFCFQEETRLLNLIVLVYQALPTAGMQKNGGSLAM